MPSSLGPAPGSMASLSIDESSTGAVSLAPPTSHVHMGGAPPNSHAHMAPPSPSLDAGTPTVPVITPNTE